MSKIKDGIVIGASLVALVLSLIAIGIAGKAPGANFGYVTGAGVSNFDILDVTQYYRYNGTAVTSGTNWIGGINTTSSVIFDALGSGITTLTAGTATTSPTAAQICDSSVIEYAPSVANASATLPTAVALQADCLGTRGAYRDILWENTSVAASTTIFVAGASTTIEYVSSTAANGALSGADGAILRFYNSTSTTSNSAMVKVKVIPFND